MKDKIVIIAANRTPIGKLTGAYSHTSASQLGSQLVTKMLDKYEINKDLITGAYFGNVIQAGNGQNIARQIVINAGLNQSTLASTINEVCGSGMKAIELGMNDLLLEKHDFVLVGGVENMTMAPYLIENARVGAKYNNLKTSDSMFVDGLRDSFSFEAMGITAENVATKYNISREMQDEFAYESQLKAFKAQSEGLFNDEIIPFETRKDIITKDEGIRGNTTIEKLNALPSAFVKEGSVTAGNSSTINDGASALILTTESKAKEYGYPILGYIEGYSEIGMDPNLMGFAPYYAIEKLLKEHNLNKEDIDYYELNEAFAAQSLAVINQLGIDKDRVNIKGGAIALGHPLGNSGCRIVVTLLHTLLQNKKKTGIATLCIGGGLGMALLIRANVL